MRAAQRRAPEHVVHPQAAAVGELPGNLPLAVRPGRARPDAPGLAWGWPVAGAGIRPGLTGVRVGVLTPPSLVSAAENHHRARSPRELARLAGRREVSIRSSSSAVGTQTDPGV